MKPPFTHQDSGIVLEDDDWDAVNDADTPFLTPSASPPLEPSTTLGESSASAPPRRPLEWFLGNYYRRKKWDVTSSMGKLLNSFERILTFDEDDDNEADDDPEHPQIDAVNQTVNDVQEVEPPSNFVDCMADSTVPRIYPDVPSLEDMPRLVTSTPPWVYPQVPSLSETTEHATPRVVAEPTPSYHATIQSGRSSLPSFMQNSSAPLPNPSKPYHLQPNPTSALLPHLNRLPFETHYALTRYIRPSGPFQWTQINRKMIDTIASNPTKLHSVMTDRLKQIFLDNNLRVETPMPEPSVALRGAVGEEEGVTVSNLIAIYHVTLSFAAIERSRSDRAPIPTIEIYPVAYQVGHRAARKYGADRFLTVEFRWPYLRSPAAPIREENDSNTTTHRHKTLPHFQTITFAGRTYTFLHAISDTCARYFATSTTWSSPLPPISVAEVLNWHMPIAPNLDIPLAKFAKRVEMMFSGSLEGVTVMEGVVDGDEELGDEVGGRRRVMTDGSGMVCEEVLRALREKCGWEVVPCAFQGRYGPYKGTWMLFPPSPPPPLSPHPAHQCPTPQPLYLTEPPTLLLRPSQKKYSLPSLKTDTHHHTIDVLTPARSRPACLNYQFIRILVERGVRRETFGRIMQEAVQRVVEKVAGAGRDGGLGIGRVLEEMKGWSRKGKVEGLDWGEEEGEQGEGEGEGWCVDVAIKMLDAGFLPSTSPHLHSLLTQTLTLLLTPLHRHLKIPLPNSRRLLILPDPTQTLPANTAYLHIPHICPITHTQIGTITGPVIVGRNPAFLANEMRKVQCVNEGMLERYRDVLVVSVRGGKGTAEWLGGGDYDGDEVWCCWDAGVVGEFREDDDDLDTLAVDVSGYFDVDEMKVGDVIVRYGGMGDLSMAQAFANEMWNGFIQMEKDQLGLFVRAFDRVADEVGITHPTSIELATLCAELLDAQKAGKTLKPVMAEALRAKTMGTPTPIWLSAHIGDEEKVVSPFDEKIRDVDFSPFEDENTKSTLTYLYEQTWRTCRNAYFSRLTTEQDLKITRDVDLTRPWLRLVEYTQTQGSQYDFAIHAAVTQMGDIRDDFLNGMRRIWDPSNSNPATPPAPLTKTRKHQTHTLINTTLNKILTFPLHTLPLPYTDTPEFHDASLYIRCSLAYYVSIPYEGGAVSDSTLLARIKKWAFPWRIPEVTDVLCRFKRREEDLRVGRMFGGTRVLKKGVREVLRYR
ncbi:hypothetical protein HDV00_005205 [Rhizophlyctis rosea]|nr:hypothetical protein HDV00_005205 [Rhizophlyctis rosea]